MNNQKIELELWDEFKTELDKKIQPSDIKVVIPQDVNHKKFWETFLTTQFPSGDINKTLEKNFAIYLIKNKLEIEQVKEKYKQQGWNANALLGWVKKVNAGDILEYNVGELIKWCKEYAPELSDLLKTDTQKMRKDNPFKKLHYATQHLPYFHEFKSLAGLHGRQYTPILKARYYQLLGGIIQRNIHLGKLFTDTRIHVAYPLPTEAGKNDLIYSIKDVIKEGLFKDGENNFKISVPTSYHPEQLIGKYIEVSKRELNQATGKWKNVKRRIENRGHLDNDFLEFDECTILITSKSEKDQEAREKLSTAENPIGRNEVEKRLVDDTPENAVKYEPVCTNSYYFQPFKKIPEEAFLQGFLRRKLIPVGNVSLFLNFADENLFGNKISSIDFSRGEYLERVRTFLDNIRNFSRGTEHITFNEEAIELLNKYSLYLLNQGRVHSEKISNLTKIVKYSTLSYLAKFSVIIAFAYGKQVVDKSAVSLAYMDLVELYQNTYDFIYERTYGDFSYGTSWGGANWKEKQCLQYLMRFKAFSKEQSGISIADFKEVIKEIFDVKDTRATEILSKMRKSELVETDQVGSTETKIWLKFNPKMQQEEQDGLQGYRGYTAYNYVFENLKSLSGEAIPM